MGYKPSEMGLKVQLFPDDSAEQIIEAYQRGRGYTVAVAHQFGVDVSTVRRWVFRLDQQGHGIRAAIWQMREDRKRSRKR